MHLTGYLRERGFAVEQRDLSVKVARDVLCEYGDETTEELLELLQNPAVPPEAKREAGTVIDELAIWIRDNVDSSSAFRAMPSGCVRAHRTSVRSSGSFGGRASLTVRLYGISGRRLRRRGRPSSA